MALVMTNTACAKEFEKDTFKAPSGKKIEIYAIKLLTSLGVNFRYEEAYEYPL